MFARKRCKERPQPEQTANYQGPHFVGISSAGQARLEN